MAAPAPAPPPALPDAADQRGAPIAMPEFVALIAALMALGALGVDAMLPALPAIGEALGVTAANDRQYVIAVFLGGMGMAQLVHGPLADRFGRRGLLVVTLVLYALGNALAAVSASFALLLAARFATGAAIASTRVACIAMVRDCYHGRAMARIMSIAFIAFMIVPIVAPTFGWAVLQFGDWRTIFWVIAGASIAVLTWFALRMPETLAPEDRHPIDAARILAGWRLTLTDRLSVGYMLATTALMGALYGYLNSIEQIMADVFGRPALLVIVFATTAGTMAVANLLNATLVMRLGTRFISHTALIVLIAASALHAAIGWSGHETLLVFAVLQAITMGAFGLATSNFSAMAMERMGHIAGTASSVQGFVSITLGTGMGALIGQAFDGSTGPLTTGFCALGLAALAIVAITERGRLFRAA